MNTFELEPHSSSLPPFREKLHACLKEAGLDENLCHGVILSVDEVLTNIIRYAYKNVEEAKKAKIQVTFSDLSDRVEIQVEDQGPPFDPRKLPAPQLPSDKPGGLGIYLVKSLMDKIDYEPLKPRGNRLRLVKYKNQKKKEGCCNS